jgi:hypothetical protein
MELDPGPIQELPLNEFKTWINLARKVINEERERIKPEKR